MMRGEAEVHRVKEGEEDRRGGMKNGGEGEAAAAAAAAGRAVSRVMPRDSLRAGAAGLGMEAAAKARGDVDFFT